MIFTKKSKDELTQELLAKVLKYDDLSGHLTWLGNQHSKSVVPGSRAGCVIKRTGYRQVSLFGKSYAEHRLIWFIKTGKWPTGEIDHIDQNRSNNSWANLREVTKAENARNRSRRPDTKVGEHGIWYNERTGKYVAEITLNGKKVYQKSFDDPDKAVEERKAKSLELGFHENHGNIK